MLDITNHKYKEYVKEIYANQILDADNMKSLLALLIPGRHATELSVRKLSIIEEMGDYYQRHFAKRYDFVDLTNKRAYEFDGDQHFSQIDHFDKGNYASFVDRRNSDLTKQRILVELGYDLVRISGKISVSNFVDLLSKINIQKGQSLFIENDDFFTSNTKHLSTEPNEIEMLKDELFRTKRELLECKDQLSLHENQINEKQKNKADKKDVLIDFMHDLKMKRFGWSEVPMKVAYEYMKEWSKTNAPHLNYMRINTFSKMIDELSSNSLEFYISDSRLRYNSPKYQHVQTLCDFLKVDPSALVPMQRAIVFMKELNISKGEINEFNKTPDDELSDRDIAIIRLKAYRYGEIDKMLEFKEYL